MSKVCPLTANLIVMSRSMKGMSLKKPSRLIQLNSLRWSRLTLAPHKSIRLASHKKKTKIAKMMNDSKEIQRI